MTIIPPSWSRAAALLLAVATATPAQTPLGADVEIFGDDPAPVSAPAPDLIRPAANLLMGLFGARRRAATPAEPKNATVPGMEQLIVFQDGRQMRGKLLEIAGKEVVWSRPDISQPLRFGRADVRRISLSGLTPIDDGSVQIFATASKSDSEPEPTSDGTVQFGGADWLHGEISSADGQSFGIQLPNSAKFAVSRGKIAWISFGKTPVTGFGLNMATVESWTMSGEGVEDAKDGRLLFKKNYFVGKTMNPPKRFEVSFELPVGKADETVAYLWLQPYQPRPNNYSNGTQSFGFGQNEIRRKFIDNGNGIKDEKSAIPADAPAAVGGWNRFRVLYDGVDRKVAIVRNGKKIGEWKLGDDKLERPVRGLCFNGENRTDMLLGNVLFRPWDGDLSALDKVIEGDRLAIPGSPTEGGEVTAITGKTIRFSGADKELKTGAFLALSEPGGTLTSGDATLSFDRNGELSVADLEIRAEKARFRTNFAPKLEIETKLLGTILFQKKISQAVGDILVFKNGDELPGKLIATNNGAALKWKTPSGFEVDIQPERVAGVRFSVKPPAPPVAPKPATDPTDVAKPPIATLATLELKNGDRLPGELVSLEKDALRFKHKTIGEREIPRSLLWSYFPSLVTEGAARWLDSDPESTGRRSTVDRWITVDGAYFARVNSPSSNEYAYLSRSGMKLPPRYEIRCTAVSMTGEPYFTLSLTSAKSTSNLNMSFSSGEMNINGYSQRTNGRSFSVEVPLRDKFKMSSNLRTMRVFVDSEKGTTAIMLNGILVKKLGSKKEEVLPGLGDSISFSSYSSYSATKLSNLWIGPWNGEVPNAADPASGSVALKNGDVTPGNVLSLRDGKVVVATDVGEFEMPMERIVGIEFGGAPAPIKTAGRIRLRDGAVLNVDEFHFEADGIAGKSPVLGELKFATADVAELVLAPQPARFPSSPAPKKVDETQVVTDAAAPKFEIGPAP